MKIAKQNLLNNILVILLAFYLSIAIGWDLNESISWFSVGIIFIISYLFLKRYFSTITSITLKKSPEEDMRKELILYGFILLIVFVLSFLVWYPAVINADITSQWRQVQTGNYSNWHPVVQTILFLKLPTLIYNHYISCTIFQMLFIGTILLYFCIFLRKYFLSKKGTILVLLLIVLNPSFSKMSMFLIKDIAFSWLLFLGTLISIEIVLTKGKWIEKISHKILFVLMSLGIMLFRHNGIISIFCLLVFLILIYKKDRKFYLIVGILLFLFRFLLYGPIYHQLGIASDGGKSEMIGVPLNQIAYIYHQNVKMTPEELDLFDKLAPKKKWEEKYRPGNFNTLKFDDDIRPVFIPWVNENFNDLIKLYIKYAMKYPDKYLRAYLNVTSSIWTIRNDSIHFDSLPQPENHSKVFSYIKNVYDDYASVVEASPFKYIFMGIGTSLFGIIVSFTIVIIKSKKHLHAYLPYILVLSNTAVIMMLTTAKYEIRFVYSQMLCVIPLLIYALYLKKIIIRNEEIK